MRRYSRISLYNYKNSIYNLNIHVISKIDFNLPSDKYIRYISIKKSAEEKLNQY